MPFKLGILNNILLLLSCNMAAVISCDYHMIWRHHPTLLCQKKVFGRTIYPVSFIIFAYNKGGSKLFRPSHLWHSITDSLIMLLKNVSCKPVELSLVMTLKSVIMAPWEKVSLLTHSSLSSRLGHKAARPLCHTDSFNEYVGYFFFIV